jgi:hypothetical protein
VEATQTRELKVDEPEIQLKPAFRTTISAVYEVTVTGDCVGNIPMELGRSPAAAQQQGACDQEERKGVSHVAA